MSLLFNSLQLHYFEAQSCCDIFLKNLINESQDLGKLNEEVTVHHTKRHVLDQKMLLVHFWQLDFTRGG